MPQLQTYVRSVYLSKSLSIGWKKSYLGGNFFRSRGVTGEQNPYNDERRYSKYSSHLLINVYDKNKSEFDWMRHQSIGHIC